MAKEIDLSGVNLGGGKRGAVGGPATPPVPVNGDVYVSGDKPYTFRLDIATMNRLERYCAAQQGSGRARGTGKGAIISKAINMWLDATGWPVSEGE